MFCKILTSEQRWFETVKRSCKLTVNKELAKSKRYCILTSEQSSVSATNFLLPKINNIVGIRQYSNYYRFPHCRLRTILSKIGNAHTFLLPFPHCRLRTILSKIGNAHTFLLPFSALPVTNNIVENRKWIGLWTNYVIEFFLRC